MRPTEFRELMQRIRDASQYVEGWLSPREAEFLALAAANPTAEGDVLEIGSFRGRSTIALALAVRYVRTNKYHSRMRLVAVDPMLDDDPLMARPLPRGEARRRFDANLQRAGVGAEVEFHQAYSYQLATRWDRPLRMLWIDGDHAYASAKQDFDLFSPFLADGAILAMHDVLSRYDGCIRVFIEDVLGSPHFGAVGLCGSIGWAQYWHSTRPLADEERQKQWLLRKLTRLLPYHCQPHAPRGLAKLRYKWLRSRVPHQAMHLARWQDVISAA